MSLTASMMVWVGLRLGFGTTFFVNFHLSTSKMIKLSDLLKEGTFGKIEAIAEASFRRDHNLSPKESLSEESFNFPEDHFRLNDNFGLDNVTLFSCSIHTRLAPVQWARPKYEYPSNLSVACSKWIYALGRRPRQLKCFGHKVLSILVSPRLFSR